MFYLITVEAETAAALAGEGQSPNLDQDHATDTAIRLRDVAERIKILSSAIAELSQGAA